MWLKIRLYLLLGLMFMGILSFAYYGVLASVMLFIHAGVANVPISKNI